MYTGQKCPNESIQIGNDLPGHIENWVIGFTYADTSLIRPRESLL